MQVPLKRFEISSLHTSIKGEWGEWMLLDQESSDKAYR
jgi:hypothetical protein